MKKKIINLLLVVGLIFVVSCSTAPQVDRVAADTQKDLSGRWNDTDSRLVSEQMIRELISRAWIADYELENNKKPVVIVGTVRNKTSEHIATETFIKDIERELVNSGRVKFVASSKERDELRKERMEQQSYSSVESAKDLANETGADFMLKGSINSHFDSAGGQQVKYYQIDLELINVELNEKVWMGNQKIKKIVDKKKLKW